MGQPMKKLLLTILFCLIPCVLFAGGGFTAIMAGGGAGGAACGSLGSQETNTSTQPLGTAAGTYTYGAIEFTPTTSGLIRQVQFMLADVGNPSATPVYLAICTSDGETPPAPTTTCTNADTTVTAGDGTNNTTNGTSAWKYFNFNAPGYSVETGTYYFFRLYSESASDTNYYQFRYNSSGNEQLSHASEPSTWTSTDQSITAVYRITSCVSW